jgi:hypothetical protein
MITGHLPQNMDAGTYQRIISLTKAVNAFQSQSVTAYSLTAPTPTAADRGIFCIVRDANGVDTLYVCLLNSSSGFEWAPVVQSS